jgi:hypothetical protein
MPVSPTSSRRETPNHQQPEVERRSAVRYVCCRECIVRPEAASGVGDWPGMTANISANGICLATPFSVSAGTVLVIEPWGPRHYGKFRARVLRSWLDGFVWFHGCEFARALTDEELKGWLAGVPVEEIPGD